MIYFELKKIKELRRVNKKIKEDLVFGKLEKIIQLNLIIHIFVKYFNKDGFFIAFNKNQINFT